MKELIVILSVVFLAVFGLIHWNNVLMESSCRNNLTEMGREYRYDWTNGCRIGLDDGTFIYWKMYRQVD